MRMFPECAPAARRGVYSLQFLTVSGGHIFTRHRDDDALPRIDRVISFGEPAFSSKKIIGRDVSIKYLNFKNRPTLNNYTFSKWQMVTYESNGLINLQQAMIC